MSCFIRLQILANGNKVGVLSRNLGRAVSLDFTPPANGQVVLDVLVEELGRDNGGTEFDTKGLMSGNISLDGESRPSHIFMTSLSSTCSEGRYTNCILLYTTRVRAKRD